MRSLLLLPLATMLVACGGTERSKASGDVGGTLVVVTPDEASSLLPPLVTDATGRAITDQLYDRLAEIGPALNTIGDEGFAPRLAQKWTWAPDSLSIAFALDPRARWHDGVPVRASDVRFSHLVYANPKVGSPVTPLLGNIDSVSVKDSLTAVVWFKKHVPSEFFDYVYQEPILAEHVLGKIPPEQLRTSEVSRHPVGTGRFRFVRWDGGSRIEIVADTANFRGRAKLDRVIWSIVPDPGAGLVQLFTGQADLMEVVPFDQLPKLDSSKTLRSFPLPSLGYGFFGFNTRDTKNQTRPHPIFGDRRVRRALSMAVDRRAMLENVFGPYAKPGHGPFPQTLGIGDSTLQQLPYDTVRAKALLDSAGWKEPSPGAVRVRDGKPLRFSILVPTSSKQRMTYGVLLQSQLRKAGAQVDLDQVQFNTFLVRQDARDFDSFITVWNTDPGLGGIQQNWSTAATKKGGQNALGYSNPEFDALLDSALASFDPAKARTYGRHAFQVAIDDAPAVWLYDLVQVGGVSRRLRPAAVRADESWWSNLADWTIPADQRIDRDRIGLAARPQ